MRSNLDSVFLPAIIQLAATSKDSEKLLLKKLAACWTIRGVCEKYLERLIREDLVLTILEKKLTLVSKAKTSGEIDQILRQPRPRYNYGIWEENPLCIPEEELVWWAIVSANTILRPEAQERFQKLFAQVVRKEAIPSYEKFSAGTGSPGCHDPV